MEFKNLGQRKAAALAQNIAGMEPNLIKGKALPMGTRKKYNGVEMEKTPQGWKLVKQQKKVPKLGDSSKTSKKEEVSPKKKKDDKIKDGDKKPNGTKIEDVEKPGGGKHISELTPTEIKAKAAEMKIPGHESMTVKELRGKVLDSHVDKQLNDYKESQKAKSNPSSKADGLKKLQEAAGDMRLKLNSFESGGNHKAQAHKISSDISEGIRALAAKDSKKASLIFSQVEFDLKKLDRALDSVTTAGMVGQITKMNNYLDSVAVDPKRSTKIDISKAYDGIMKRTISPKEDEDLG